MKHLSPGIIRTSKKLQIKSSFRYNSYQKIRPKLGTDSIEDLKTFVPDWLTSNKDFVISYKKMKHQVDINLAYVCQRSHASRTKDEKKALYAWTRGKSYFAKMPKTLVKRICDKFNCVYYKTGEISKFYIVISEGDEPHCMYMIYDGKVGIYIKGQRIHHISSGEHLGEHALENDEPRSATAIAETNASLLKLKKTDYEDIILTIKKNEKKKDINFLKSIPIFQLWNDVKIMSLSHKLTVSHFSKGEIVYDPDEFSHSFYIIKEGNFEIQTEIKILESNKWPVSPREWNIRKITKKIYHPIQFLREFDFFGQIEIIDKTCRVTRAIAKTNSVCFIINRNDFEDLFNTKDRELLKNNFKIPSKEELESLIKKNYSEILEKEKILLDVVTQNKSNFLGDNKKSEKWKKFVQQRIISQRNNMRRTVVKHTLENIVYSRNWDNSFTKLNINYNKE